MKTQHTPGPWRLGADNAADGANIHAGKKDYIGHTCGFSPRPGSNERQLSPQEARANARLIASAPELLAALEIIVGNANGNAASGYYNVPVSSITNARAAISKATGVQP